MADEDSMQKHGQTDAMKAAMAAFMPLVAAARRSLQTGDAS